MGSSNGAVNVSVSGGTPFSTGAPYQCSWTGPNGFTSSAEDISDLRYGWYAVTVIDGVGNETMGWFYGHLKWLKGVDWPISRAYLIKLPSYIMILD